MTYCVGWKTKHSIFIIADTGISSTKSVASLLPNNWLENFPSSIGEKNDYINGKITEELLYKVRNINNKLIYSFAGNVTTGLNFSIILKQAIEVCDDERTAIEIAVKSCTPLNKNNEFSAMIGFMEGSIPSLVGFNLFGNNKLTEVDEIIHLGSGKEFFSGVTNWIINSMKEMNYGPDVCLTIMAGYLQHFSIHYQLPLMLVGGVFFGGKISESGFKWMQDISYILYADDSKAITGKMDKILVMFREGFLIIKSTINNSHKFIYIHQEEEKLDTEKVKKNIVELNERYKTYYETDQYIFLSKRHPIITLIDMNNNYENEYFSVNYNNINIKEELISMLVSYKGEKTYDSYDIQFQWVTA